MKKLLVAAALLTAQAHADQDVVIAAVVNGEQATQELHITCTEPTQSVCMKTTDYTIEGTVALNEQNNEVVTSLEITDENGNVIGKPCVKSGAHGTSEAVVAVQETANGSAQEVVVGVAVVETEAETDSRDEQAA